MRWAKNQLIPRNQENTVMKSMTGHGVSYHRQKDTFIEIVVQSLNNRFLETRFRMPDFYSSLEGELRKKVQQKFTRGSVEVLIHRNPSQPHKDTKWKWNHKRAVEWRSLYKKMSTVLKLKNNIDLVSLSRQPGVVDIQSVSPVLSTKEKQIVKKLLQKAVELCDKERVREGAALKKDFQSQLTALSQCLQLIKKLSSKKKQKKEQQLKGRMSKEILVQQPGVANEVVLMLARMDINEEISRMTEHIRTFRTLITKKAVIGKQMNFYLQEMIREMNTIGSKSQEARLTREVVSAKTIIETMREQVQNVE